jgi:hypothetical protein
MGIGILLLVVMVGPPVLCAAALRWAPATWLLGFETLGRHLGKMQ